MAMASWRLAVAWRLLMATVHIVAGRRDALSQTRLVSGVPRRSEPQRYTPT